MLHSLLDDLGVLLLRMEVGGATVVLSGREQWLGGSLSACAWARVDTGCQVGHGVLTTIEVGHFQNYQIISERIIFNYNISK